MATLTTLRSRIRNRMSEQDTGYFNDSALNDLINEGQLEFADITKCLDKYATTVSVDGEGEYTLMTDAFQPFLVHYGSGDSEKALAPWTREELADNYSSTWWTLEGTPLMYYVRENLIGLVPMPDENGTQIKVWYKEIPETMSADADEPRISEEYHNALVYYSCRELCATDENRRFSHFDRMWINIVKRAKGDLWRSQREKLPTMKSPADEAPQV